MKHGIIQFAISLCILGALLITGCTDKSTDSTDRPENKTGTKVTIDAAGGILAADDFQMTVPQGALNAAADLELLTEPEDETFGSEAGTPMYMLTGLPENITKPLHIRLKYSGEITGDPMIAFGQVLINPVMGDTALSFTMIGAADSSGYLTVDLPVSLFSAAALGKPSLPGNREEEAWLQSKKVQGIIGNKTVYTKHFTIIYPVTFQSYIDEIGSRLENSLNTCINDLGCEMKSFLLYDRINILFRKMNEDLKFTIVHNIMGDLEPAVTLNRMFLEDYRITDLTVAAGGGLINMFVYDNIVNVAYAGVDEHWFIEAVLNWSTVYFSPAENPVPKTFSGHEWAPFTGMQAGAGFNLDEVRKHGKGMAALIQFLTQDMRFGLKGPFNTIRTYRESFRGTDALLQNVNDLVTAWLPDFFQAYIGGEIYNVSESVFTDPENITRQWGIYSKSDTVKVFTASYPDLSARCFLVTVDFPELDENKALTISIDGEVTDDGLTGLIYAVHGSSLELLGRANAVTADLTIPELKANAEAGVTQYLIAVVNSTHDASFKGSSDIDVTFMLTGKEAGYNACEISAAFNYITDFCTTSPEDQAGCVTFDYWEVSSDRTEGQVAGSTYTGSYTFIYNTQTQTDNITAVFNEDQSEVIRFEYTRNIVNTATGMVRDIQLTLEHIPLTFSTENQSLYSTKGTGVCAAATAFSLDETWDNGYTTGYERLKGSSSCDANSEVAIVFWR